MTWAPFGARVYWAGRETPRPLGKGAGPAKRRGLIHKEGKLGERGKRQRDERSFINNREREKGERVSERMRFGARTCCITLCIGHVSLVSPNTQASLPPAQFTRALFRWAEFRPLGEARAGKLMGAHVIIAPP